MRLETSHTHLVDIIDAVGDVFEALHEPVEAFLPYLLKYLLCPLRSSSCVLKLLWRLLEAFLHSVQSTTHLSVTATWHTYYTPQCHCHMTHIQHTSVSLPHDTHTTHLSVTATWHIQHTSMSLPHDIHITHLSVTATWHTYNTPQCHCHMTHILHTSVSLLHDT